MNLVLSVPRGPRGNTSMVQRPPIARGFFRISTPQMGRYNVASLDSSFSRAPEYTKQQDGTWIVVISQAVWHSYMRVRGAAGSMERSRVRSGGRAGPGLTGLGAL